MAEIFNSFFVTIASDIDSKIIYTNTNYKDYLQQSVPQPVSEVILPKGDLLVWNFRK